MRFRCWVPDEGYTREDAKDFEAADAAEAAELMAERWFDGGDHFSSLDVAVAAWGSGTSSMELFRVTVDYDPSFSAKLVPTNGEELTDGG